MSTNLIESSIVDVANERIDDENYAYVALESALQYIQVNK